MRAFFLTTDTPDVPSLVRAWDCWNEIPAKHFTFDYSKDPIDAEIIQAVAEHEPDIIFYIGACGPKGTPSINTFQTIKKYCPSVHFCCDSADKPWWPHIEEYRRRRCFDLQVGMDGQRKCPMDYVTLTPVDPRPYLSSMLHKERDIKIGFSGGIGWGWRYDTLNPLESADIVTVRRRGTNSNYQDHVDFMERCKMIINLSFSGTEEAHQVKGRVLECALTGAAILEWHESPIGDWFPRNSYFTFSNVFQVEEMFKCLTDEQIIRRAVAFKQHYEKNYQPKMIYQNIIGQLS